MWNRVFLLASGFAFGWVLVSYLTVPLAQVRDRLIQLVLSLSVGLVVIGFMAFSSPQSGIAGGLVFAFSALVAYAGNARQIGRVEALPPLGQAAIGENPIDRPKRPLAEDSRIAVVLVAEGEPVEYDGPKPWARRFAEVAALGGAVPHWFVRPFSCARIRAAYRKMGGRNPFNDAVARLTRQLEGQLDAGYRVQDTYLGAAPSLGDVLARLAEGGSSRVVLLPIGFEGDSQEALREVVVRSRVREVGIQVAYAAPLEPTVWNPGSRAERLRQLARGGAVDPPPEPGPEAVERLRKRVLAA